MYLIRKPFLCFLLAIIVAHSADAQVSATFTTGAIAEYRNTGHTNQNAVSFDATPRAIESVTIGQSGEKWGGDARQRRRFIGHCVLL